MASAPSTQALLLVNAATVAFALGLGWSAATLMWPYWIQSVVIGYYSRKRILALERFSWSTSRPIGAAHPTSGP